MAAWFADPGSIVLHGNPGGWSDGFTAALSGLVTPFMNETRIGWAFAGVIGASILLTLLNRLVRS